VRALEFPTFPDWNRECRSASVVGQAVPPGALVKTGVE